MENVNYYINALDDYFDFSKYTLWTESKETIWYRCTAFSSILIWVCSVFVLPVSLISGLVNGNINLPVLDIIILGGILIPYLLVGPILYWLGMRGNLDYAYWGGVLVTFFSIGILFSIVSGLYSDSFLTCFIGLLFISPSLIAGILFIIRTQCLDTSAVSSLKVEVD